MGKKRPPNWRNYDAWVLMSMLVGLGIAVTCFFLLRRFLFPGGSDVSDIISATATALGGLTIGGVAVMQYRKHKWAEYQAKLDEDSRTGERLSKAIEHLGSGELYVRIGAMHEFVRLAADSERDREAIGQILLRFIHSKTQGKIYDDKNPLEQDVETATHMLRYWTGFGGLRAQGLHLEGIWLKDAYLKKARFYRTYLNAAHLEHANMKNADFEDAILDGAHLEHADMWYANLKEASLHGAHLENAILYDAHLDHANLSSADLTKATLVGASLDDTDFRCAILTGASFYKVRFERARLFLKVLCIFVFFFDALRDVDVIDDFRKPFREVCRSIIEACRSDFKEEFSQKDRFEGSNFNKAHINSRALKKYFPSPRKENTEEP